MVSIFFLILFITRLFSLVLLVFVGGLVIGWVWYCCICLFWDCLVDGCVGFGVVV